MAAAHHWQYHQCYYELYGRKPASFLWCIKACTNLNDRKRLIEMTGKTLERIENLLVLFLKYGRKNLWKSS